MSPMRPLRRLGRAKESRRHIGAVKGRVTVSVLEAGDDGRVATLKLGVDGNWEASISSTAGAEQGVAIRRSTKHNVSGGVWDQGWVELTWRS